MFVADRVTCILNPIEFMEAVIVEVDRRRVPEKDLRNPNLMCDELSILQEGLRELSHQSLATEPIWIGKHHVSPFLVIASVAVKIFEPDISHARHLATC